MTSTGNWLIELGDVETASQSIEVKDRGEVFEHVSSVIRKQSAGRLAVSEDVGERSWLARKILAMHPRVLRPHLAIEWSGEVCSLIFHDEAAGEYRARDRTHRVAADEETRRKIAHGEIGPHPIDECMRLDRGLNAIHEYLQSGQRPSWLDYDHVA